MQPISRLGSVLVLALSLPLAAGTPAISQAGPQASAGAYLAARSAMAENDFPAAVDWFTQALAADPANPDLLESAIAAELAMGALDKAGALAAAMEKAGHQSQITNLAHLASLGAAGDYAAILQAQDAGRKIFPMLDLLIQAWAEVGVGKMSEAAVTFDKIIADPGSAPLGMYHKALALAQTGDFEGAEALFSDPKAAGVSGLRRGIVARVQVLSQLERGPEAVALIDERFGAVLDAGMADLRRRAAAGEPIPFDLIHDAREGLAEAFFTWATLTTQENDLLSPLLSARIAAGLRPDHVEAQLMAARLLDQMGQHDLAITAFQAVPEGDPAYVSAVLGQANAALLAGRAGQAVELLTTLSQREPKDRTVLASLGDALRADGKCDAAITAYGAAIATIVTPGPGDWPLYYRRGGCAQVVGDWAAAETDLSFGLTLAPDEPRLLNELGYAWVDRGENLDRALEMLRRAVAGAPDQGYILDSLAWAYYRLGQYDQAVAPQEAASQLMPVDPVVTDHLGDIYWAVGRVREAEYQWHRALSFKPEEKDAARIRLKLEKGLDAVLADEKRNGG